MVKKLLHDLCQFLMFGKQFGQFKIFIYLFILFYFCKKSKFDLGLLDHLGQYQNLVLVKQGIKI